MSLAVSRSLQFSFLHGRYRQQLLDARPRPQQKQFYTITRDISCGESTLWMHYDNLMFHNLSSSSPLETLTAHSTSYYLSLGCNLRVFSIHLGPRFQSLCVLCLAWRQNYDIFPPGPRFAKEKPSEIRDPVPTEDKRTRGAYQYS